MPYYAEYTTIADVRGTLVGSTKTDQDDLYYDLIVSTSRDIDKLSGRKFVPRIETLLYDTPQGRCLKFGDRDILEVQSITNGDGTTISPSGFFLEPANDYPKSHVELKATSGVMFQLANGEARQALSVVAITGYHGEYAEAWPSTLGVLAAAIETSNATTFTCTTGKLRAGDLIQIGSEWMYVVSVTVAASDTVTVVRGVNGSTAATHLVSAPIYRWSNPSIEMLCRNAVLAQEKLKNNPVGETVALGGYQFVTPKDVTKYIETRLRKLGLVHHL
jgi:hypothetical protein